MKEALIIFYVVIWVALGTEEMFKARRKCIQETNLTRAEYDEVLDKRPLKTDNKKVKCYFACLLINLEWMDTNGTIASKPGVKINEQEIEEAQPCLDVNGTDTCDTGFNFYKCDIEIREKKGRKKFYV